MFNREEVINRIIPYRLGAIDTANKIVCLRQSLGAPKSMKIYFDGQLIITGNSAAFTNPVLEAGLLHCRALLDFLGLMIDTNRTKLTNRKPKDIRGDDWAIECFSKPDGQPLAMVSPQDALSLYDGPKPEAEAALVGVIHTVNKSLAHMTSGLVQSDFSHLEIASRGIPALVITYFYTPLGLPPPKYEVVKLLRRGT